MNGRWCLQGDLLCHLHEPSGTQDWPGQSSTPPQVQQTACLYLQYIAHFRTLPILASQKA